MMDTTLKIVSYSICIFLYTIIFYLTFNDTESHAEQLFCSIDQITHTTDGINGANSLSSDGSCLIFASDNDITGGNPGGNIQLYLYDLVGETFTQLTNTSGGFYSAISVNSDCSRFAFTSDRDLTGNNPDGNGEIFFYDFNSSSFTQVTDTTGGANQDPSIDSNGGIISFESNRDITTPNPEGNFEIYFYDVNTMTFTRVTDTMTGISVESSIDGAGTKIAFRSTSDLTGGNPDGNREIYLYEINTMNFTQLTDTVTAGLVDNASPTISEDGNFVAFSSIINLNGMNPDQSQEIFLLNLNTFQFTQLTKSSDNATISQAPEINSTGSRTAFQSNGNFGVLPGGNLKILIASAPPVMISPVTTTLAGTSLVSSISGDGNLVSFRSDSNLTGQNFDGNAEIFIATCSASLVSSVPTLSEWSLVALVIALMGASLFVIRRKAIV